MSTIDTSPSNNSRGSEAWSRTHFSVTCSILEFSAEHTGTWAAGTADQGTGQCLRQARRVAQARA
jgi:hypothetical protein